MGTVPCGAVPAITAPWRVVVDLGQSVDRGTACDCRPLPRVVVFQNQSGWFSFDHSQCDDERGGRATHDR